MMTKQEFLIEITLRMAGNLQESNYKGIVDMAVDITDRVFKAYDEQRKAEGQWWSKEVDEEPVSRIVAFISNKRYRSNGYGVRINNIFKIYNIRTVGDILRLGKINAIKLKDMGAGSISHISDALEELYNIKEW